IQLEGIGTATETAHQFPAEDGGHAGREPAVWSDGDVALLGLGGERELLPDYRIVASEIGEVAARVNSSLREPKVQAIGDRGERAVVPAHQADSCLLTTGIQGDRADFSFACDFVYPGRDFASALQIAIG